MRKKTHKRQSSFFKGKATVFGRVTSASGGRPVSGAEVHVTVQLVDRSKGWPPCAETEAKTTTDSNGRYEMRIDGLKKDGGEGPVCYFAVEVMATRFVPERLMPARRRSRLPFTGTRRKVDAKLKRAFALTGKVTDERGRPLSGVEVIVYQSSSHGCFNPLLVGGDWPKTGKDGRFLADGMPIGLPREQRQVAGFFHPEYERRFVQRIGDLPRNSEGVASIDVKLRKGLELSGAVRDTRGRRIKGASVLVMAMQTYEGDPGCARSPARWGLKTDKNGRFVAKSLPRMYYHVIVTHKSHPSGSAMFVNLMRRSRKNIEVVLDRKSGVLAGTVTEADGSAAAGVTLTAGQYASRDKRVAQTNKRGRYRMDGFVPGLVAGFDGFSDLDTLAWFVPPNKTADIVLPRKVTVAGRLVDACSGRPVRGKKQILLSAEPRWGRGFLAEAPTASGVFKVREVWPGTYYVCADAQDYQRTCRKMEVGQSGCDLGDVPIHRGVTLQGTIRTSNGKPVAGADVFIDSPQFYDGMSVRTNARGRYVFRRLSDGTYHFRVRTKGWATFCLHELALPLDKRKVVKDVRMRKGVRLSGKVMDGSRPVTKQMVILSSRAVRKGRLKRPWISDTATNEDGLFVFENVSPGKYALRCGIEERNITVRSAGNTTCNFRWPGKFKLRRDWPRKGGHAK
jgi:hypothetical protein